VNLLLCAAGCCLHLEQRDDGIGLALRRMRIDWRIKQEWKVLPVCVRHTLELLAATQGRNDPELNHATAVGDLWFWGQPVIVKLSRSCAGCLPWHGQSAAV